MSDQPQFTFTHIWRERRTDLPVEMGQVREYTDQRWFTDLVQARTEHLKAVGGQWVQRSFVDAHVSALRVWKWGRLLSEDLERPADWCPDHRRFRCGCGEKGRAA